jgi:hypothetical protein
MHTLFKLFHSMAKTLFQKHVVTRILNYALTSISINIMYPYNVVYCTVNVVRRIYKAPTACDTQNIVNTRECVGLFFLNTCVGRLFLLRVIRRSRTSLIVRHPSCLGNVAIFYSLCDDAGQICVISNTRFMQI